MTAVVPFDFSGQQVRVLHDPDGSLWFVAADVARILGYRDAEKMTRRLDPEDRGTRSVGTPGGDQLMSVISEAGLYVAILGSKVAGARDFKRWITHDLIPTVRQTGSYGTPALPDITTPTGVLAMAEQFATTARALVASEAKVAELAPAADAWNYLAAATGDFSLRDAAQMLNRDPRIDTGQNRLMKSLEAFGMVDGRGRPYQRHASHLRRMPRTYEHPNTHEPVLTSQIRITADGLRYLHRRITGDTGGLAVAS